MRWPSGVRRRGKRMLGPPESEPGWGVASSALDGLESDFDSVLGFCEVSGWDELDEAVSLGEGWPPMGSSDMGFFSSLDLSPSTGAFAVGASDLSSDLGLPDPDIVADDCGRSQLGIL